MAKAEFYKIIIKDKKEQLIVSNISLSETIINYLNKNDENDNFCQKKRCAVILNNYAKQDEKSVTFDFAKLTNETVMSTLISEPSKSEDTFFEYHKKILETTKYTKKEKKKIESLVSLFEGQILINKLKQEKIEKFHIYKILLDNELLKSDELYMFENQIIKRLKKDSIYFQIIENFENTNSNILLYQTITNGLDIEYLQEYLNTHLLISENFKVYFHKLYDATFMDLLQNAELKNFIFSYNIENKNNLLNNHLFNPFYSVGNFFGSNTTQIEIKSNKDKLLNNEKLLDFFEKATEAGLLDSCELKTKDHGNKKIDFKDKKLTVEFTQNIKITDLDMAILFFEKAIKDKENIVRKRLGL